MDDPLKIEGQSTISTSTLIRITNLKVKSMMGSNDSTANVEGNIKGVLNTIFTTSGTVVFDGTVTNMGSTEAILSTINLINESNNSAPTCITMSIDGLKVGDRLTPSQSQNFTATVTSTCTEASTKESNFSLSYIPVNPNEGVTTIDERITNLENQVNSLQAENAELKKDISKASEYYKPKDLTNVYSPSELAAKVKNEDFSGLHIGDYFKVQLPSTSPFTGCAGNYQNVNYIQIAGFDSYKNQGVAEITKNHIVFVFKNIIDLCPYNDTGTNEGGYTASKLKQNVDKLTSIKATDGSGEDWYNYIIDHSRVIGEGKQSSAWNWQTAKLYLLQEVEVTGSMHWSNGYGNGVTFQLPLFAIYGNKEIVKRYNTTEYGEGTRRGWWLESPSSVDTTDFVSIYVTGIVSSYNATTESGGVVPAFLFGA